MHPSPYLSLGCGREESGSIGRNVDRINVQRYYSVNCYKDRITQVQGTEDTGKVAMVLNKKRVHGPLLTDFARIYVLDRI